MNTESTSSAPQKKMLLLFAILFVGIVAALGLLKIFSSIDFGARSPQGITINTAPFTSIAQSAQCADQRNAWFAINDQYIFWHREGNCPDNGYEYVLYGTAPDNILCTMSDSIAGPRSSCDTAAAEPLFSTITEHLDESDLGLSADYSVVQLNINRQQ